MSKFDITKTNDSRPIVILAIAALIFAVRPLGSTTAKDAVKQAECLIDEVERLR